MNSLQAFFIFIFTFFLFLKFSNSIKINTMDASKIFIWRTIICLAYIPILYSLNTDSYGYYFFSVLDGWLGSSLIRSIVYIFKNTFHLSFVSCSLIFSFIGSFGSIILYSIIKKLTENSDKKLKILSELVVYFPILNLWTAAIGKDAITFTCINLIIYSFLKIRSRIILLIFSCLILGLVRPHYGLIIFGALIISFTRKMALPLIYKLIFFTVSICLLIFMNNFNFLNWGFSLGLNNLDLNQVSEIFSLYASSTNVGATAVDISSYNLPTKLFTYMFRPLFFDAKGLFSILMSFENLILLLIISYPILIYLKKPKLIRIKIDSIKLFLIVYLMTLWISNASGTANLGLAYRHKLTILPALLFLTLSIPNKSKLLKKIKI